MLRLTIAAQPEVIVTEEVSRSEEKIEMRTLPREASFLSRVPQQNRVPCRYRFDYALCTPHFSASVVHLLSKISSGNIFIFAIIVERRDVHDQSVTRAFGKCVSN